MVDLNIPNTTLMPNLIRMNEEREAAATQMPPRVSGRYRRESVQPKGTSMSTLLKLLSGLTILLGFLHTGSAQAQFRAGAAGYNPYTGYGGRAGVGYNPYTGNVAGGRTAYNPYTGRVGQSRTAYNPYTGASASVQRAYNPYTGRAGYRYSYRR